MRRRYVVTYDISDPKRLRETFKVIRNFGDHLQLSVFECLLSDMERTRLEDALREVIKATEDQVLLFDLGLAETEKPAEVRYLGRPYRPRIVGAIVV